MRRLVLLVLLVFGLVPGTAAAGPGLLVGLGDDTGKWSEHSMTPLAVHDLDARAQRVTVRWQPGQTALSGLELQHTDRAVSHAWTLRTVLAVSGKPDASPQTDAARDEFCAFTRSLLLRYPQVNDFVIWNEVNKAAFWRPQYNADSTDAAPAAYEALLARCWDVMHAQRASVNLITSTSFRGNDDPEAVSNVSHSPGSFYRAVGVAYRASGRTQRIFDTLGHNPYPLFSNERPWRVHHDGQTFGEGDYASLMQALWDGFSATGQPVPGSDGVTMWYLEDGFQTQLDPAKAGLYNGAETDKKALPAGPAAASDPGADPLGKSPAPDQATQLVDAVRLAYCQPAVGAFFNFMAVDETGLAGWQSGILWSDGSPKPSYPALRAVFAEVNSGSVDCGALKGGSVQAWRPLSGVVASIAWPRNKRPHPALQFKITTDEAATYRARLVSVPTGRTLASAEGRLTPTLQETVALHVGKLARGRYRFRVELTSSAWSSRHSTLLSAPFRAR